MLPADFWAVMTQIVGFDMEGSQYFHLAWDTILLINAEVATLEPWGDGTEVPIYDHLFLGAPTICADLTSAMSARKIDNGEPLGGETSGASHR